MNKLILIMFLMPTLAIGSDMKDFMKYDKCLRKAVKSCKKNLKCRNAKMYKCFLEYKPGKLPL